MTKEIREEGKLLAECRNALGYTRMALARFLGYREDRFIRRCEHGQQDIPTLLWLTLFYMLREDGKRQLMNDVHAIIQQRRKHNAAKEPASD